MDISTCQTKTIKLTILGLWKPTWPTSIEAVFFKLDQGVYTTSMLFTLFPVTDKNDNSQYSLPRDTIQKQAHVF